jgi:multiple sugar transport system ATP-binding protein
MASGGISGKRAVPVTFDKVAKSFGSVLVLEEFDIQIDPGEFLVLLGASGSGKTTALRILSGLETATSGRVRIGDRDVTDILPKYRDISMVFQSYALYPHKTVAENIGFPLKVRKVKAAEMDAAIRDAAAQVRLGDLLHRYPRELSGGQRQRVALARAIIRRPSVFLMDEPLSNLDAKLRGHMRAELKHMQETLGTTTIYVTHDQIEAMTLAHRVAILERGVLQQLATPREIYDNPANLFVAGFIGSPPMNTLDGAIADGAFVNAEGKVPVGAFAPRPAVVFGFRPEDARVVDPAGADLRAAVYACELTGNETIVTLQMGKAQTVVKMDKNFDVPVDTIVGVTVDRAKLCLFDPASGERIRTA